MKKQQRNPCDALVNYFFLKSQRNLTHKTLSLLRTSHKLPTHVASLMRGSNDSAMITGSLWEGSLTRSSQSRIGGLTLLYFANRYY